GLGRFRGTIDVDAVVGILTDRAAADQHVPEAESAPFRGFEARQVGGYAPDVDASPAEPAGPDVLDSDALQPRCVGAPVEHQHAEALIGAEAVAEDEQVADHDAADVLGADPHAAG